VPATNNAGGYALKRTLQWSQRLTTNGHTTHHQSMLLIAYSHNTCIGLALAGATVVWEEQHVPLQVIPSWAGWQLSACCLHCALVSMHAPHPPPSAQKVAAMYWHEAAWCSHECHKCTGPGSIDRSQLATAVKCMPAQLPNHPHSRRGPQHLTATPQLCSQALHALLTVHCVHMPLCHAYTHASAS
jgi:hypothetical protein